MSLKEKGEIVGDLVILTGLAFLVLVTVSLFVEIKLVQIPALALAVLHYVLKINYNKLRTLEIDEEINKIKIQEVRKMAEVKELEKAINVFECPSKHIFVEKGGSISYSSDLVRSFEVAIESMETIKKIQAE